MSLPLATAVANDNPVAGDASDDSGRVGHPRQAMAGVADYFRDFAAWLRHDPS